MNVPHVLKYVKDQWDLITNINTLVPGSLSEDRTFHTSSPYAVMTATVLESIYTSDNVLSQCVYFLEVEVWAENPDDTSLDAMSGVLESLAAKFTPGAAVGPGTLNVAWRSEPSDQSFKTDDQRDEGEDVIVQRLGVQLRVQWA